MLPLLHFLVHFLLFFFVPAPAPVEQWASQTLLNSDSVEVVLRYKPVLDPRDEKCMELRVVNKTAHTVNLDRWNLSFGYESFSWHQGKPFSGWLRVDFRNIDLFSEWKPEIDRYFPDTLHAFREKQSWKRLSEDMSAALMSNYATEMLDTADRRIALAPRLYFIGKEEDVTPDTIYMLRQGIRPATYPALARRLDNYLNTPKDYLTYWSLLDALLQQPVVAVLGEQKLIQALLDTRFGDSFRQQRIISYLKKHCNDCSAVDDYFVQSIQADFNVQSRNLLRNWGPEKYVLPLIECLEGPGEKAYEAMFFLKGCASTWNTNPALRRRVARRLLELHPLLSVPADSLTAENAYSWQYQAPDLIATRDSLAVVCMTPFLKNKFTLYRYSSIDFSNVPRYLPPTRVCDVALCGIYYAEGKDLWPDLLRVSGKKEEETRYDYRHFGDRNAFLWQPYMEKMMDILVAERLRR